MRSTRESRVSFLLSCLALTGACGDATLDFRGAQIEIDEVELDPWIADVGIVDDGGESVGTTAAESGSETDDAGTDEGSSNGSSDATGSESSGSSSGGTESGSSSDGGTWSGTWSETGEDSASSSMTDTTGDGSDDAGSGESSTGSSDSGTDDDATTTTATSDEDDSSEDSSTGDECVPPETTWHCANEDESCECFELEDSPDEYGYFSPDPPLDDTCEMPVFFGDGPVKAPPPKTAELTVKYSRGNNDDEELEKQKTAAGVYQYQTAGLELKVKADRSSCACGEDGKVTGDMLLTVNFKASGMSEYWRKGMKNKYFMICGEKPAKATTQVGAMADPGPNLKTYGLSSKIGKLTDGVTFTDAGGVMTGEVTCKLSCETGDHINRVYLPNQATADKTGVIYDPAADTNLVPTSHIDTKVSVTKEGAITVEPRYIEYIVEYPWLEATKPELATVEVVYSTAGGEEKAKKTWQIAKLIHDGTNEVGKPFKARAF